MSSQFSAEAVKIAQKAQSAASLNPMTDFDQTDSIEAEVSSELYEEFIQALLIQEHWRFAMTQQVLNHIAAEPDARYTDAWQLPSDPKVLAIRSLIINDRLVTDFDRYQDKIFVDADENSRVVLEYVYRAGEEYWPPDFKMYAIMAFASLLATVLTRNEEVIASLEAKSERLLMTAMRNHSQGRGSQKVDTKRLLRRRGN